MNKDGQSRYKIADLIMKVCCCCSSLRLGLVQMSVSRDKHANLAKALGNIRKAAALGAEMVILPVIGNFSTIVEN